MRQPDTRFFPGSDDDIDVPAFFDSTVVDCLDHHVSYADRDILPVDRYDSSSTEPQIMKWLKITAILPRCGSLSASKCGTDSDADEERTAEEERTTERHGCTQ